MEVEHDGTWPVVLDQMVFHFHANELEYVRMYLE